MRLLTISPTASTASSERGDTSRSTANAWTRPINSFNSLFTWPTIAGRVWFVTAVATATCRSSSAVSAAVTRVPVQNGHTASISVALEQRPDAEAIVAAWNGFRGRPQELGLPSAPSQPIVYLTEPNRPQPALDANRDGGMTVTVGRLRRCPVLDYKFVALGHNTIRGAAGAAILNAEILVRDGRL